MQPKKPTLVIGMLFSMLLFFGCTPVLKENTITVTEFHDLLSNQEVILLDVRTPKEVAQGKIKRNALEADFFEDDFIEKITSQLPKDKDVYVYCRSGKRSGKTVTKLRELGYSKIYNVEGGIKAWKAKGFEIE
ncbi:rhodanese-like domain-containing protein [Kordia sp.]|uniref:rhodanese-like domain-containing protein n=1 Tax=Kordia sp. TaxID=1965332 RepID=UPI003D6ABC65